MITSSLLSSPGMWVRVGTFPGVQQMHLGIRIAKVRVPPVAIYARLVGTVDGHPSDQDTVEPVVVVEHRRGTTGVVRSGRFVSIEAAVEYLVNEYEGAVLEVLDPLDPLDELLDGTERAS